MSMKARNLIPEDDPRVSQVGHPAPPWMSSYADLMTELVCFFVILYAMSAALNKKLLAAKNLIETTVKESKVEVVVTKDGMQVTLRESGKDVFFESGSAELTPVMVETLKTLGPILNNLSDLHELVVEGHTDNVPVRRNYQSNWELSSARATNVVRYLVQNEKMKPQRISAVGYGEYRPVTSNDTPEGRSKNRRVVFFIRNNPPPDKQKPKEAAGGDHAKTPPSESKESSEPAPAAAH